VEAADSPFRGRFHWSRLFLAMPLDSTRAAEVAGAVASAGAWSVPTLVERDRALAPPATVRGWMEAAATAHVPVAWRDAWAAQLAGAVRRMDDDDWRLVARGAEQRRQMVRALRRAGVGLLVGTDTPNAFVVPGFSVHDELAAFVAAGVPPEAALAAATRDAARFAGAAGEWGTVQVGARADLVLLRADPLADVRATRDPAGVMARGRWYPAARLAALLRDARH
jgi:imidazolonepropionase-like amidohydrolase